MTALLPITTLGDYLHAALLPYKIDAMLSPSARAMLEAVAARLPSGLSKYFGLECRLGEAEPTADFLLCVDAPGERSALAGLAPARGDNEAEVWRRVRAFATDWPEPAELLWLEFDSASTAAFVPSVFFGAQELRRGSDWSWIPAALATLRGEPPPAGMIELFGRCIDALPDDARVFQIGTMLSRPEPFLRVCTRDMAADAIPSYLQRLGWTGAAGALADFLPLCAPLVDDLRADLDLTDRLGARLGLECKVTLKEPGDAERLMRWIALLERLGLCLPAKAGGLRAWSGLVHQRLGRDRWPADQSAAAALAGEGTASLMQRTISHVKIVFEPDGSLQAKAYLAVRPILVKDADLARMLRGA